MKKYYWRAINPDGQIRDGALHALNKQDATLSLHAQQFVIIKISQSFSLRNRSTVSTTDLALFYRQLSTLLQSGTPLLTSLMVLLKNAEQPTLENIIQQIKAELEAGITFSNSLKKFPQHFDSIIIQLLHIAEQTGTLDTMLLKIASHQEKLLHLKKRIQQILFYPALLLIMAIAVSTVLLLFVVPHFEELFASFNAPLPFFTLLVIHFSHLVTHYFIGGILLILLAVGGFKTYYRRFPKLIFLIDQWLLQIPALGKFIKKYFLSWFSRNLSTMLHTGLPITQSLSLLIDLNNNIVMQNAIRSTLSDIAAGQRLHVALQNQAFFPPMMMQMVRIGEESGSLAAMLDKIADFYESDLDHWTKTFSSLLEPLIITILGVLIGGLIIAMYLPIFKLGTVI